MKKALFLLLLLILSLAACGPSGNTDEPTAAAPTAAGSDAAGADAAGADAAGADADDDTPSDTPDEPAPAATAAATAATVDTDPSLDAIAASLAAASEPRPDDHARGADADAYITIIEYSDFQCPGCGSLAPLLHQILDAYPNDVRLIYRHFPLVNIHPNAQKAAEAAEAANAQGSFWEYHDTLFARQAEFSGVDEAAAREQFISYADELGLDVDRFTEELDNGVYTDRVDTSREEAISLSMPGTPTLIFNGELVTGEQVPPTFYYWDAVIKLTLLEQRAYDSPPPMTIDTSATYHARVKMASGDEFVIEFLTQSAPQTVNSFIFLAREGWFDGITFHRVLPDFVAQTGDPTGTGFGGPGYFIVNEIDPELTHAEVGIVAMANSGPDRNGSQWYVTLGDVSELDGSYTIFGRVIEGMDVVQQISPRDPATDPEAPPGDMIESVTIEEQTP